MTWLSPLLLWTGRALVVAAAAVGFASSPVRAADALRSFWSSADITDAPRKGFRCEVEHGQGQFIGTLDRIYRPGRAQDSIDPEGLKRYEDAKKDLKDLSRYLGQLASEALKGRLGRRQVAECVVEVLTTAATSYDWKEGLAREVDRSRRQNALEVAWFLPAVTDALQIAGVEPARLRAAGVDRWLRLLSSHVATVILDEDWMRLGYPRVSNQSAWAGTALMGVAVSLDDPAMFDRGAREVTDFLATGNPDGSLPSELVRGGRTLYYHAFSAQALARGYLLLRGTCDRHARAVGTGVVRIFDWIQGRLGARAAGGAPEGGKIARHDLVGLRMVELAGEIDTPRRGLESILGTELDAYYLAFSGVELRDTLRLPGPACR